MKLHFKLSCLLFLFIKLLFDQLDVGFILGTHSLDFIGELSFLAFPLSRGLTLSVSLLLEYLLKIGHFLL
jgi:hypothetical protein